MSAQNIISLGLNVDSFNEEKKKRLDEFIVLFDKLEKYDGMKVNPVAGEGLAAFNQSVSKTSTLLDELNAKITNLNSKQKDASTSSSNLAKSNTELGLAVKEYAKQSDDAAKTSAKLSVATSEQAKQLAALKVEMQEQKKALIEEARANNESYKARLAAIDAEKKQTQASKDAAVQQKKAAKDIADAQRQASKDAIAALKASEKQMKENEKQVQLLNDKHLQLKNTLKSQQKEYVNNLVNFGADDNRTKSSLTSVLNTQGAIDKINLSMKNAEGKSNAFFNSLSKGFSVLTKIAYILPGLGIAGIFTMAFEAIEKVADASGLLNSYLEKQVNYEKALNKSLEEKIQLNERLLKIDKELQSSPKDGRVGEKGYLSIKKSEGVDESILLTNKLKESENNLQKATASIIAESLNSPESLKSDLDRRLVVIQEYANKSSSLQKRIDEIEYPNPKDPRKGNRRKGETRKEFHSRTSSYSRYTGADTELLKSQKAVADSKLKIEEESYKRDKALLDNYINYQQSYFEDVATLKKFNDDEERRKRTEFAKEEIATSIQKNEVILASEIESQKRKIKALRRIAQENKDKNYVEEKNVLDNNSSTPKSREIATNKRIEENKRIDIKLKESEDKLNEEYRQRFIKAQTEIDKAKVQEQALVNEKIFLNDKNSLGERLSAYMNYVVKKQQIQDLEYLKDKERLSLKANDPTARKELEELEVKREQQKASIQADAQKRVYDITSSSLTRELKIIEDANNLQEQEYKSKFADELSVLNKSFGDKKISVNKYLNERRRMEDKYQIDTYTSKIIDDEQELKRIRDFIKNEEKLLEEANDNVKNSREKLDVAEELSPDTNKEKLEYDTAVGNQKAISDAIIEAKKKEKLAEMELGDDKLKLEERRLQRELELQKAYASKRSEIVEELLNLVQETVDAEYDRKIANLQREKEIVDEQYGYQIEAIDRSSLSAKDKNALDIQLSQQKIEYDKRMQAEERRLRTEKAMFDRDMALANIVWSTAQNAAAVSWNPILFAQVIAIGAIQAATVLAKKVPSFAEGVENFEGGMARYGEAGPEIVVEPGKKPYIAMNETISYLPKGTDIIPISDSADFSTTKKDTGWEQTRWLAKQLIKSNKKSDTIVNNVIKIDTNFEVYKQQKLYGK